jgi:hypothetical protein
MMSSTENQEPLTVDNIVRLLDEAIEAAKRRDEYDLYAPTVLHPIQYRDLVAGLLPSKRRKRATAWLMGELEAQVNAAGVDAIAPQ